MKKAHKEIYRAIHACADTQEIMIHELQEAVAEVNHELGKALAQIDELKARAKELEERQIVFPTYVPGPYVVDGDFYVKVCNVCGETYKLNQIHICRELRPWKDGGLK